jgi:hypothetical protein
LKRLNRTGHWRDALDQPSSNQENEKIADAVGEWADEDALAAHYGYSNDYFCTEDLGKSAIKVFGQSILDPAHRTWLTRMAKKLILPESRVVIPSRLSLAARRRLRFFGR